MVDSLNSNLFCKEESGLFSWLFDSLTTQDPYFHLADFAAYIHTQSQVGQVFKDKQQWAEKAILNVARIGKFSSDRTIQQYADEIWEIKSH